MEEDRLRSGSERSRLLDQENSGLAPNVAYIRRAPRDYKFGAIIAAIFCFLPTGILAVYFASKVRPSYNRGQLERSLWASEKAKLLIQISMVLGGMCWFGGLIGLVYVTTKPTS